MTKERNKEAAELANLLQDAFQQVKSKAENKLWDRYDNKEGITFIPNESGDFFIKDYNINAWSTSCGINGKLGQLLIAENMAETIGVDMKALNEFLKCLENKT